MHTLIDVVLPAHNEGGTIRQTLEEFYQVAAVDGGLPVRFVVSEDGSKDDTVEVIKRMATTLPIELISHPVRKGYSRAVIDGFKATTSPLVCFIDSDGQCDPKDLKILHQESMRSQCDIVVGYRNPRKDSLIRLLMSRAFNLFYRLYFDVGLKDPSCPFLLIKREAMISALDGNVGILREGFWWEFFARARAKNLTFSQVPITHRIRGGGTTVVYRPAKIPGIAWSHLCGVLRLSCELKENAARASVSRSGRS